MSTHPGARRAGFTLIEMLVAVSVAGIALAAGFAALAMLQERTAYARESGIEVLEGASTRALIMDWIQGARLQDTRLRLRFQGMEAQGSVQPFDEMYFPTTGRTPLDMPVTLVRLLIDQDPETPEEGLVAEIFGSQTAPPLRMELVPQVTGMEIRYLPDVDGDVEWISGWNTQDGLPRGVEITLAASGPEPLPPLLALPIRVALATLR